MVKDKNWVRHSREKISSVEDSTDKERTLMGTQIRWETDGQDTDRPLVEEGTQKGRIIIIEKISSSVGSPVLHDKHNFGSG